MFYMVFPSSPSGATIKPDPTWTDVESWAWKQIQLGNEVRLPGPCPTPKNSDPDRDSSFSHSDFSLRGTFLQQILTTLPYRDIATTRPILIHGANIVGNMLADGGTSHSRVIISCSTFDGTVLFNDWEFLHRVHFHKIEARESIGLRAVHASSRFTISNSDVQRVEISGSTIDGNLSFRDTSVHDKLTIINTKVENSLLTGCRDVRSDKERCATYGATHFTNLSVGRSVHLVGSFFKSKTIFESIRLAGNFIADDVHYAGMLIFIGGTIEGRVYMTRSSSNSVLSFIGSVVRGGVDLSESHHASVKILDTDIYRDLDLTKSDISFFFDITGSRVHGALRLAPLSQPEQERADSANKGFRRHFTARNAYVTILEDTTDAWNRWSVLDLNGFEYEKLSSPSTSVRLRADNPYLRDAQWFKRWLEGLETYSPQPYSQLSELLRREGQIKTANAILFEGKERERTALSWGDGRRWWLELLSYSIGYGVGLGAFRALGWMALFAAISWLVTTRRAIKKDGLSASLVDRLWYSITFTVPGFTLVTRDELTVSRLAQSILYVQRLICFTLALLAGAAAVGIVHP